MTEFFSNPIYINKKKEIEKYLRAKKQLEKVDSSLIDELCFNYFLVDESKRELIAKGLMVNVSADATKPYYQVNHITGVYNQAIKNINTISTKLGLTPQERNKLKVTPTEKSDGFED